MIALGIENVTDKTDIIDANACKYANEIYEILGLKR